MAIEQPSANPQRLYLLLDYDNLRRFSRGKSLVALVNHLVGKLPDSFVQARPLIELRLYGGWRSGSRITVPAQQLAIDIAKYFPLIINRSLTSGGVANCKTNVTLAYSPLFLPSTPIEDTYIKGRSSRRIYSEPRPWISCFSATNCALSPLELFLSAEVCPDTKCAVSPDTIFRQDEQKQVDTMLVADLAHLAYKRISNRVVVVSSDSDIWPGILLSLAENIEVLHIQTSPGGTPPRSLTATLGALRKHYQTVSV